jgi:hypothetical protein
LDAGPKTREPEVKCWPSGTLTGPGQNVIVASGMTRNAASQLRLWPNAHLLQRETESATRAAPSVKVAEAVKSCRLESDMISDRDRRPPLRLAEKKVRRAQLKAESGARQWALPERRHA